MKEKERKKISPQNRAVSQKLEKKSMPTKMKDS